MRRLIGQRNLHVAVTGSSARLLSHEIATSLRGRALAAAERVRPVPVAGRFPEAMGEVPHASAFVVTIHEDDFATADGKEVRMVPAWRWLAMP